MSLHESNVQGQKKIVQPTPSGGRLSVIIPTLNEQLRIERQLHAVRTLPGSIELIVSDGGSDDHTVERAQRVPGVRVVRAARGRARQLNAGARSATGEILLFLHADVSLPADARQHIDRILSEPDVVLGAFRTWTMPEPNGRPLGPLLHLADLRSRYTSLPYGDQALFLRRDTFERVGGFPEQALMEDLEFSLRLHRLGKVRTAPARVTVSGRRFQARPLYYLAVTNTFPLLYRLGVPAERLSRWYRNER